MFLPLFTGHIMNYAFLGLFFVLEGLIVKGTPAQAVINSVAHAAIGESNGSLADATWLRLFTNDIAPNHGMDSATFVFGSQSLAGLGATSISATDLIITPGSFIWQALPIMVNGGVFIGTATVGFPCTVYGYVAVASDSITPVYAERLPSPVTLTGTGQGLTVNPGVQFSNNFIG